MKSSFNDKVVKVLIYSLFLLFSLFWLSVNLIPQFDMYRDLFSDTYGVYAGLVGIIGLFSAQKWGGLKSFFGKTIFFFSVGIVLQFFGQLVYSYYYLYLHIDAPYPSIGDIGFFGSIPAYLAGLYFLAKTLGINKQNIPRSDKVLVLLVPAAILSISYVLFLREYELDWTSPITTLLDFGYPLGQALYVSFATLAWVLSRELLGGVMRSKVVLILLALIAQYTADFTFLFMINRDIWTAGGINDYTYLVSYFLMGLSLVRLNDVAYGIKSTKL